MDPVCCIKHANKGGRRALCDTHAPWARPEGHGAGRARGREVYKPSVCESKHVHTAVLRMTCARSRTATRR